jgi:1-acyl-sn-glycerol-3-phosphate acyltransferase
MNFLRALLFNISFYGITAVMCIACLPGLCLPRKGVFWIVRTYLHLVYMLEKYILGLNYRIEGWEHVPKRGPFLIAAKHQSAYETLKLHRLLQDPAIILKKELLSIPLWGRFLSRIDPIAIDRSQGRQATQQVIDGARRVSKQGRPMVIFPQGTRVRIDQTADEKPYKIGVARMQEETGLPIIPLALNSGKFWPRKSWMKYPGCVTFKFLPPIEAGEPPDQVIKKLQETLERESQKLL